MAERPEDLSLPASVVARIIKDALPEGVNVSKEARTAIGKAASVFILYATACANNFALKNKRKTLSAGDVFSALEDMEFEEFIPELKDCLEAYRQEQKGRKEAAADRKKRVQAASLSSDPSKAASLSSDPSIKAASLSSDPSRSVADSPADPVILTTHSSASNNDMHIS